MAKSHIAAFNFLYSAHSELKVFNIGTGQGHSVLDMIHIFERTNGIKIPYEIVERRKGDIAECWMSSKNVERVLGWKANYRIEKMCEDAWRWQQKNPDGYS